MFTYVQLFKLTPEGQGAPRPASPKHLEKIKSIVRRGGRDGRDSSWAFMGPWDFLSIVKYPDNETAFRVLAKIGLLRGRRDPDVPGRGGRDLHQGAGVAPAIAAGGCEKRPPAHREPSCPPAAAAYSVSCRCSVPSAFMT